MGIFNFMKDKKGPRVLVSYDILFDSDYCSIKPRGGVNDELLITSFILYLSRYFFICDERQLAPMKKVLEKELIKGEIDYDKLINKVASVVYDTLYDDEKEQLNQLAYQKIALPYDLSETAKGTLGKYKFDIVQSNVGLGSIFDMSPGLDIVLLPRLVVLFYGFVRNNLDSKKHHDMLLSAIKSFFKGVKKAEDYYEQDVFVNLPQKIIMEMLDVQQN